VVVDKVRRRPPYSAGFGDTLVAFVVAVLPIDLMSDITVMVLIFILIIDLMSDITVIVLVVIFIIAFRLP
jgi:hypothetical protein